MNQFAKLPMILFNVFWILSCINSSNTAEAGIWSKSAIGIRNDSKQEIPSPDNKKSVIVNTIKLKVLMDGNYLSGMEKEGVLQPSELVWSPDSKAFFITSTDGGAVGTWFVNTYLVKNNRVFNYDVTKKVINKFKEYFKCDEPEMPNIGAVQWLNGSKELLLAAESPPHSTCRNWIVRGYIVEVPTGKIIKEFNENEFREKWMPNVGDRLLRKWK